MFWFGKTNVRHGRIVGAYTLWHLSMHENDFDFFKKNLLKSFFFKKKGYLLKRFFFLKKKDRFWNISLKSFWNFNFKNHLFREGLKGMEFLFKNFKTNLKNQFWNLKIKIRVFLKMNFWRHCKFWKNRKNATIDVGSSSLGKNINDIPQMATQAV